MIVTEKTKFENNRYILNEDYVLNELGLNLIEYAFDEFDANPSTLPERILKRTSNMVYEYMKLNCKDFYYACELIENDKEIYNAFVDALQYQLEGFIIQGDLSFNTKEQGNLPIFARTLDILVANGLLYKRRKPSFEVTGEY